MASRWNQLEQGAKRRRSNQGTRGSTQPAASNPNKNRKSTDTNRNNSRPAAAKPAPKAAPKAAPKQNKPSGVQKVQQKVTYFTNKNKPKQTTQQTSLNRLARQKGTAQVLTGKQTPLPPKRATRMGQTLNPMEQLKTDAKLGRENWISRATVPAKPLTAEQQKKKNQQTAKQSGFNARARKQTLSSYDQKLSQGKQFQIQQAKQRFDEAKAKGDSAGMAKAHREAESLRYGSGYSGGASGNEYITGKLSQDDYNRLNADGQKAMKQARLTRSGAVTEEEIARADRRIAEILNAPGYQNNRLSAAETGKGWSYGPDGRRMWAGTKEQNKEDARPGVAALESMGKRFVGQYAHLGESVKRASQDVIDRNNINKWIADADNYIQAKSDLDRYDSFVAQFGTSPDDLPKNRNVLVMRLNDAIQARAQLARIEHDVDSPYYDETHANTMRELMRERYSLPREDDLDSPVSMMLDATPKTREETFGERMLRESAALREEALSGMSGVNRELAQVALDLGDMAPKAALAAIPGVGPLLSTYAFGAGIAGEQAYNLRQQGATNSQALFQGALEGGAVLGLGTLSGAATSGAARFLASKGLQNNAVAKAAMASVSGGTFAAGGTGMRVLANKFGYGEKDNLTAGQLVQDAVIDFAFGAIFTLLSGGPKKMASRREEPASWEFFSKDMSPEEARALYLRYAKQYHPDAGGGGAVFARISDEYARYKQEVVNRAQTSYRAAAKASAEGKADVAAQAEAEYREAVGALQATMEEEIAARPEIAEAMEILGAVSRDGIKAPDLDPAQVSGIMQRPQEPTNVVSLPPAAATERSPLTMTAQEMAENDHRTPIEKAQDQGQSALELAARALQARNEARELAAQQAAAWAARPREAEPSPMPETPSPTFAPTSPTFEERPTAAAPTLEKPDFDFRKNQGTATQSEEPVNQKTLKPVEPNEETAYTGSGNAEYDDLISQLQNYNRATAGGVRYTVTGTASGYIGDMWRLNGTGGYVQDARAHMYHSQPFGSREQAVEDLLAVARSNFYPELNKIKAKEDMKNAVTSEEPGGMDQGREDLLPGDTGRRGLPDAGHPSEAQERVHGDRPGRKGNVHPDEGNDGETGAGGTRPDDSLRPEPGSDAGHAGTENGLAVPRVAEGDAGAGVGHADEGGRADVSKPKEKPKPKTNNRHNHQITEDIDSIRPNFNDNVTAIKTMKAILEAGRKATKEETPVPTSGEVQYSREPGSAAGKSKGKKNFNEAQAGIAPRPENWTTERIKGGKAETPMSLSQIISKMMHDFDLNVTFGHVRGKGVRGQFNPRDKGIRSRIEQDLPTISHELGHWLDDRAGITGRKMSGEARKELEAVLGELKDQYPESAIQSEGFAEFIRKYLTNRETAAIDYPILTETIKRGLDGRDLALLNQFADEINAYYALDANTAGSAIRFREDGRPDYRTHVERVKDLGDSVYQAWVDSNHAIKNLDRITGGNAYIYATNAAYRDNVAAQIIDGDLTDPNGRYVGPGWKTAIQGINTRNKQEWRDFGEYLVVRHGPERLDAGKRVFADDRKNSSAFMNARREELEEKYPAFKAAGDRLIEFERNLVDVWGVGTGLIESSLAESWHELYPNHVPLNRAIPRTRGGSGGKRGYANQSNPLRRAKGSGLDIVHPAENIIDEIVMLVNAGTLNRVMQMVAGEAESMGADAMFMEKVPTPMVAKKFSMTGIKETLDQAGNEARLQGMFSENAQATFDEIVSSLDDVMIQYERGKAHGNVVTVMRNGNPEFWKVNDEALLDSLTHLSAPQIGGILEAYAKTTRFMTANITGNNLIWSLFSNAPRDLMTFFAFSRERNPGKAIPAIGSAYLNAFRQRYKAGEGLDPLFAEYLAMGGGHASAYSADANLAKRARKSATANGAQRALDAINPINWVSFVSDTIEMGPRFATYKMMRQAGMEPHEAFYQAMDVTTNFRKAGYQSRQINKVVPFFNASVQGVDKFARFFSAEDAAPGKRGKTAAGRFTAMVAVSAALAAVLYALNNRDDDRKRDYQQLSTYTKNAYWCIPMEDGKFFTIPKPRELAVMTSLFETVLERTKGGNEHAFDEFYDYAVENFLPSVFSDLAEIPSNIAREGINEGLKTSFFGAAGSMGLLGVGFYMGANRDFLGRPIESQSLQNMEPRDRFTNSTSKMAYYIGQGLNLSPQMIDYLGNQVLGYVWKVPKALFPVGEDPDFTLGVKATYLKDSEYSTDLVNRLYDRKDRSDRAASSKDDIDIAINAKLDNTMTTFYGRFNKLNRDRDDTNGRRAARQTVLTMIHDYLGQAESGQWPDSMKRVLDAVRRTGSTELMPTALNAYIEDGDSKHNLTDSQYVEYQTMYNGYYYDVAGQAMSGVEPGSSQEAAILRQAKSLAKDKADEAMLKKLGVNPSSGYTEKYPGISDQDIVRFKASLQLANEDGSLTQEEVISVIDDMMRDGLSKGNASTLFHSKYESDKHNKYK